MGVYLTLINKKIFFFLQGSISFLQIKTKKNYLLLLQIKKKIFFFAIEYISFLQIKKNNFFFTLKLSFTLINQEGCFSILEEGQEEGYYHKNS